MADEGTPVGLEAAPHGGMRFDVAERRDPVASSRVAVREPRDKRSRAHARCRGGKFVHAVVEVLDLASYHSRLHLL
eukprot:89172-Heterocapsa_arctica.AAC.1